MKLFTAMAATVVLMAGMAFAQQQETSAMASKAEMRTGSNAEQQLKDLENKWAKASLASDGDAIAPMLSDDFVNLDSDGTMHTKAESVDRTKKAKFEISQLSEMKVTDHGDTAIVTGLWTGKGVDGNGKPVDGKERWTDTWVKKDGKWVCVASASAPVK